MQTTSGRSELIEEYDKSKEDDKKNKTEGSRQTELLHSLVAEKKGDDIAMSTGCTATVCCINEGKMYYANAGDSRSVLSRNGIAYPMSIDHKPDLDIEKSRIYKANGWVSEGRVKGKPYFIIQQATSTSREAWGILNISKAQLFHPRTK